MIRRPSGGTVPCQVDSPGAFTAVAPTAPPAGFAPKERVTRGLSRQAPGKTCLLRAGNDAVSGDVLVIFRSLVLKMTIYSGFSMIFPLSNCDFP